MEFSICEFEHLSTVNKNHLLEVSHEAFNNVKIIVPSEFLEHAPKDLPLRGKLGYGDLAELELGYVAPTLVPSIQSIGFRNITNETFEDKSSMMLLSQAIRHELFHVAFHSVVTPLAKTITEGIVARFEEEHLKISRQNSQYYYNEILGHASTAGFLVEDNEVCDFSPKVKHILYESVQRELSYLKIDNILDCLLKLSSLTWSTGVYPSIRQLREECTKTLGSVLEESFIFKPAVVGSQYQLSFMSDSVNINSYNISAGVDKTQYGGLRRFDVDVGDRVCLAFEFMEKLDDGEDMNYGGGIMQVWPPVRAKYVDLLKSVGFSDKSVQDIMNMAYRIAFEVYPNQEEYYAGAGKELTASVHLPKTNR